MLTPSETASSEESLLDDLCIRCAAGRFSLRRLSSLLLDLRLALGLLVLSKSCTWGSASDLGYPVTAFCLSLAFFSCRRRQVGAFKSLIGCNLRPDSRLGRDENSSKSTSKVT